MLISKSCFFALLSSYLSQNTDAFTAPVELNRIQPSQSIKSTFRHEPLAMMTGHEIGMVNHLHEIITSQSTLIADAADAVAESTKRDWWGEYLQVFKTALIFVHSKVDGPLRSVGIEQTWGPSIALFTLAVRTSLAPLSVQQSKSAEYMKALKPTQDAIREKFKDKPDTMNRAMSKLFEDTGTNPLSGCLFSILQLPVFLGLYRSVTLLAKDGLLNEPFLWIPSLDGPVTPPVYRGMEWLTTGWTGEGASLVPQLGWETTLAFCVMPIVLVLLQSFTMSVMQPPQEGMSTEEKEQMEKSGLVLKFLPLMIGYFSLQVPAGLTIYWLMSNLSTLAQSAAVKAYYAANPPNIELPDYWDALEDLDSLSPEEQRKAAEAGINTGPDYQLMIDEAKYHYKIERNSAIQSSAAWKRMELNNHETQLTSELSEWVTMEDEKPSVTEVTETEAPILSETSKV